MARVLIAGYGDIGGRLGKLLISQGHKVFGIRRNILKIPQNVTAISADLFNLQPNQLAQLNTIDFVFYIVSANQRQDKDYYQTYVLGLKNLINAIESLNVKRIFYISSTSVFPQTTGEWVTEKSLVQANHFTTQRLLEAERLVKSAPFPSTIIRFSGIYGPGRTHLIHNILQGNAHCTKEHFTNRIHSEDCAGLLAHLMHLPNPKTLYIGTDNTPALACDVMQWLAKQLSAPLPTQQNPIKTQRLKSNKQLSNARISASGYTFKYPNYQTGYQSLLEALF